MHEVERALEVDRDDAVPLLLRHPHHQTVAGDTGVVDQHVDMAEILDYLVHRSVSLLEVSGVGGITPALHSESLDLLYRILEIVVFLEVGECDVRSGRGQFHGYGLAYAACGTCNKGDLTL